MDGDELAYETVSGLAARIKRREISPVEVVDYFISRIEKRNPALNALVVFGFEEARIRAREAERALFSGAALGALHGLPLAIKDCFDFKPGWRNTFGGVPALKEYVADSWSLWPELVERAGGIIVAKANSPAFGFRGTCDNYLFGPTRNPFNLAKNSGGSSGGSAAAVAAGLVPFAEGGDGGGSIRIPAAWCGVYGYQHTFGKVPVRLLPNLFGGTSPYIHEGPLTRTVQDAALVLSVTAGYHPDDPHSYPSHDDFVGATKRSIRGMRIAYTPDFGTFPVEEIVAAHIREALRVFSDAGAIVEEVDLSIPHGHSALAELWCRMIVRHSLLGLDGLKRLGYEGLEESSTDFPPQFRQWLKVGRNLSTLDQLKDQATRSDVFMSLQKVFERFDLIVSPTLACLPVDNAVDGNTVGPSEINGEAVNPLIGWCLTYLTNFTGHPSASVPAGLSSAKLPIGLQVIGRRHADSDVLAASAEFERRRPWRGDFELVDEMLARH
jgi:amidase